MNLRGEINTLINGYERYFERRYDVKEITETKTIEFNKTTDSTHGPSADSMIQMMNRVESKLAFLLKNKNNTLLLRGKYDKKNRGSGKYHGATGIYSENIFPNFLKMRRKFVMTSFKKNFQFRKIFRKNFQFNSGYLLAILEIPKNFKIFLEM